jgi:1,2-diacylglycerol 3-beta-galactosyltransferase
LNEKARSRGLTSSQIIQYGLPIRKGFWPESKVAGQTKDSLREELGLDPSLPTVLVVGGGDGMGGIVDIAKALGEKLGKSSNKPSYQMVVVCGSNKEAKVALSQMSWGKGVKVFVQGFVSNMDEWMNSSDALVTKAGPGTIAEASICGLPCMLFAYL